MTETNTATRATLTRAVHRFPHFIAPEGATGVVTEATKDLVCLRLDEYLPGAEEWDNEVCWTPDDDTTGDDTYDARRAFARVTA